MIADAVIELESLCFATRNGTRYGEGPLWEVFCMWGDVLCRWFE